ncbi:MAG TPA: hypothetical protein VKT49_07355 [Bryobacteraceae bacterium]|nr:hypothetical protein [Bryobacteraceae bacterium]
MAVEEDSRRSFSLVNGREVFENGGSKLWRCPVCAWWRNWAEERCCGCGANRDHPAALRADQTAGGAG